MLTATNRTLHVKFSFSQGGEARHAPANEMLGNRLLQLLAVDRPVLSIVEVPASLATAMNLPPLATHLAFGMERLGNALDLGGPMILDVARVSNHRAVLLQFAVLTWLQNTDHEHHNWMQRDGELFVIDFASSPSDAVWSGNRLGADRRDHGGLQAFLAGLSESERDQAKQRFLTLQESDLRFVIGELPDAWADTRERDHVVNELMRTQTEVADACFG
jgi:hypothetical protein